MYFGELILIDITHFCNYELNIGDFVFIDNNDEDQTCRPFQNRSQNDVLYGMSMNSLIKNFYEQMTFDPNLHPVGSKISILKDGEVVLWLKPESIPYGQKIYLSSKGKPTWRKSQYKIGKTASKQDKDGFVKIRIKI